MTVQGGGGHLGGFDAESADLDLIVATAEELRPTGKAANDVTGKIRLGYLDRRRSAPRSPRTPQVPAPRPAGQVATNRPPPAGSGRRQPVRATRSNT